MVREARTTGQKDFRCIPWRGENFANKPDRFINEIKVNLQ
jgi:hypothetical protein